VPIYCHPTCMSTELRAPTPETRRSPLVIDSLGRGYGILHRPQSLEAISIPDRSRRQPVRRCRSNSLRIAVQLRRNCRRWHRPPALSCTTWPSQGTFPAGHGCQPGRPRTQSRSGEPPPQEWPAGPGTALTPIGDKTGVEPQAPTKAPPGGHEPALPAGRSSARPIHAQATTRRG